MGSLQSGPGVAGIYAIVAGVVVVSVIISEVAHIYSHWPFVILGIIVGLMAVSSINR
jgi:hypothetical protein